jgi:uncharacterized membrane protein YgdD (TMEM256/DUF423 family)
LNKKLYFFSLSGALAVILGAIGSHYIRNQIILRKLDIALLESYRTAVLYHLIHTLQYGFIVLLESKFPGRFMYFARNFSLWGMILFSGSLYLLVIGKIYTLSLLNWLGPITPMGGFLMILSWILLFLQFKKNSGS